MKKTVFMLLIVMVAAFSSCNKKDGTTTQPVSLTSLPAKATQYIETNYPDASALYAVTLKNSTASFIVTLNTTEELAFTGDGDFLGDGVNFHHGHHGDGDTIHCGDTIHGGGHHGGGHHGNGIPLDSLSSLVKAYVAANYATYTIRHAELDSTCAEGLVTEVVIGLNGQEPVKLYFDASFTYLMKESRILYADVPQAVRDYITANYAAYSTCNRATKLVMADNSLQFDIYIHQTSLRKSIRLKEDGTFVCER